MNAKTLEAVRKHGETLQAIFPACAGMDAVELCKKLRRIEAAVSIKTTAYCNGEIDVDACDAACEAALIKLDGILGFGHSVPVLINRDPRGYALKIEDTWMREWMANPAIWRLHRDMGGYGIIAPDLTND